jgi:hypothetical protein
LSVTTPLWRIIWAFRERWRRWGEDDMSSLRQKLVDPNAYKDGMLMLTSPEFRALADLNTSRLAEHPGASISPLLILIDGYGLRLAIRVGPPPAGRDVRSNAAA